VSDLRERDLPGAAHLMLAGAGAHLDLASAVFEAMLEGQAAQAQQRRSAFTDRPVPDPATIDL
jgi:ribosomal protein S12 methylthiotransferase accessory factor YcaO